ncbi:hypothetical protein CFP65_7400 [Kitasatospora sp. MMS16-BH015]|uniref:hypothetical protein n=1 Tax=Kitasatospora sp. MMS16-BH015 TaxID=2018025 RepID=UPI000CA1796B|nr:hypothetical protein [Kitasatospora sp. MMS16-BH015]AUG81981.1 hypothetical protein CFP65_7400 [Kitasatospora sp. MMS16-BH015]
MIDDEELSAPDLIGRRLLKVTTARHHYADDEPSLVHLWLHLEGLGPVLFHTPSTGVSLRAEQPHGPYSMEEYGSVSVTDDSPDVPVTRFLGQTIRSARQIDYDDGRVGFTAGLTLQFPGGSIRLLGLVDDLLIAHDRHLGTVEAHLHEDVTLARVVQTCGGFPSQWDAWTTTGQYLYLRYRHGEGTVEQYPNEDADTWDGEESRIWTSWDDGTNSGRIDLTEFLTTAGLRLAPGAEVHTTPAVDLKA